MRTSESPLPRTPRLNSVGSYAQHGRQGERIAERFSYRITKDKKVVIYWRGRQVIVLKGTRADKLMAGLPGMDSEQRQLALAKATGNFKWCNEPPID